MLERTGVLVADDEVNLCRVLAAELGHAGFNVTCVHNGSDAVEEALNGSYQVILMDVRMPVFDGLEALGKIRKENNDALVVMITAYEDHDMITKALSLGANACVNKPFDLEGLVAFVKTAMEGRGSPSRNENTVSGESIVLGPGEYVELECECSEFIGRYRTRIEAVDERTLTIACPKTEHGIMDPPVGRSVRISVPGRDGMYSFRSRVQARRGGILPLLIVERPSAVDRVQRRKYPRLKVNLPVALVILRDTDGQSVCQLVTVDIGPGGIGVAAGQQMDVLSDVDVRDITIPGGSTLECKGRIAHSREAHSDTGRRWVYGIEFTQIDDISRKGLANMVGAALGD